MRRQGGRVRNPRGGPRGFIGATDVRSATVRLNLQASHVHCRVTSRDTRPRSLSFPTKTALNGSPSQAHQIHSPQRGYGSKSFSLARLGLGVQGLTQQSRRPSQRGMGPRAAWTRHTSLKETSMRNQVPTGLTQDESPRTGYQGFL